MIVGDLNTRLLSISRSSGKKLNRKTLELKNIINQMDLADVCRTLYSNTKEYTLFSAAHGNFSKIPIKSGLSLSPPIFNILLKALER